MTGLATPSPRPETRTGGRSTGGITIHWPGTGAVTRITFDAAPFAPGSAKDIHTKSEVSGSEAGTESTAKTAPLVEVIPTAALPFPGCPSPPLVSVAFVSFAAASSAAPLASSAALLASSAAPLAASSAS